MGGSKLLINALLESAMQLSKLYKAIEIKNLWCIGRCSSLASSKAGAASEEIRRGQAQKLKTACSLLMIESWQVYDELFCCFVCWGIFLSCFT